MKNSTPFSQETPNSKKVTIYKLLDYTEEVEGKHAPSQKSVNSILAYSKALELNPSKQVGYIENILN
tara:strand:- start:344 stop:544 length:201 start_codon:yes stop_codon:yes gene_type:complete